MELTLVHVSAQHLEVDSCLGQLSTGSGTKTFSPVPQLSAEDFDKQAVGNKYKFT